MGVLDTILARLPARAGSEFDFHRHNLRAQLPSNALVPLRAARVGETWTISERRPGGTALHVTAFARWFRFRRGVDRQLADLAQLYGAGREFDIEPGDRVIDIGANIGEFSLFAGRAGAHVLAIEADRGVAALLRRNTLSERDIHIVEVPVWKENGEVEFYSSSADADSSVIRPTQPIEQVEWRQARTLDSIVAEWWDQGPIKLIKCDAEGAEPEVIVGATNTLERTKHVAFDCGPERVSESTYDTCAELLSERGFELQGQRGTERSILVASRRSDATMHAQAR